MNNYAVKIITPDHVYNFLFRALDRDRASIKAVKALGLDSRDPRNNLLTLFGRANISIRKQ